MLHQIILTSPANGVKQLLTRIDFSAGNQVVGVEILQLSLRAPRLEPGKLVTETTPAAAG